MSDEQVVTASAPEVTVKDLLEAGVHFGHQTKRWNPKMKKYIFGEKNGIYIIDLAKTHALLQEAKKFIADIVGNGRSVLFVGTKKQAQEPIKQVAEALKQPYVITRWLGGTLTNNRTIRQSVARMRQLERMETEGKMNALGKKEQSMLRKERDKLQKNLSGVAGMDQMPGAVFIVDVCRDQIAVQESVRMNIPVIAMVDTNADPDPVSYPIPSNDDAIRSIRLIVEDVGRTIKATSEEYSRIQVAMAKKRALEEKAAEEERKARAREQSKARAEAIARSKTAKPAESKPAAAEAAPAPEAPAPVPAAEPPAPAATP